MNAPVLTPDDDRAARVFAAAWSLWPNPKQMAEALGVQYQTLWRRHRAGQLPDADLDLALLKQAKETGAALKASDLIWWRDHHRRSA